MVRGMRHCLYVRDILGEMGLLQGVIWWFCDRCGAEHATTNTAHETCRHRAEVLTGVHREKAVHRAVCIDDQTAGRFVHEAAEQVFFFDFIHSVQAWL